MAACLSGTANSIREFVKEREIYERERMTGLSAGAYLMSKVLVLGVISVVQALLIVIIGLAGHEAAGQGRVDTRVAAHRDRDRVAALCVVSMLLGLVISTLVTQERSDDAGPGGGHHDPGGPLRRRVRAERRRGGLGVADRPGPLGMGALASTINLNVITPSNPLAPVKPDALWAHTPVQWLNDIGVLIIIGLICLAIAGFRLSKIGPRPPEGSHRGEAGGQPGAGPGSFYLLLICDFALGNKPVCGVS